MEPPSRVHHLNPAFRSTAMFCRAPGPSQPASPKFPPGLYGPSCPPWSWRFRGRTYMPTVVMCVHVLPGQQGCQIIRGNYGLDAGAVPSWLLRHLLVHALRDLPGRRPPGRSRSRHHLGEDLLGGELVPVGAVHMLADGGDKLAELVVAGDPELNPAGAAADVPG